MSVKRLLHKLVEAGPGIVAAIAIERLVTAISCAWSTACLKIKLRALGCSHGRGLSADGRVVVRVRARGAIRLGDHVTLKSRFRSNLVGLTGPTVLECGRRGQIVIGDHSGCSGAVLSSRSRIEVGRNVNIGGNARIFDHDFHSLDATIRRDPQRDFEEAATAPIAIGDDVFIGAHALILKGVQIGARAVIGAGAVVSMRQVPADALVAGNPGRVVRLLTTTPPSARPTP